MVAFERFLARLFAQEPPPWLLKGGYAMEVRLRSEARATKDIDLSMPDGSLIAVQGEANPERLLARLRTAAAVDLKDWFEFRIGEPIQDITAAPYGGWRFPAATRLDNRRFTEFKLDVGVGDAVVAEPEWTQGHDLLSFANIPPARIALVPREQQFAEKIHAYTLTRQSLNSRVRDLVDLVLLVQKGLPEPARVLTAVQATFGRRKTHEVPDTLPTPPAEWDVPYRSLAEEIGLELTEAKAAHALVSEYWKSLDLQRRK